MSIWSSGSWLHYHIDPRTQAQVIRLSSRHLFIHGRHLVGPLIANLTYSGVLVHSVDQVGLQAFHRSGWPTRLFLSWVNWGGKTHPGMTWFHGWNSGLSKSRERELSRKRTSSFSVLLTAMEPATSTPASDFQKWQLTWNCRSPLALQIAFIRVFYQSNRNETRINILSIPGLLILLLVSLLAIPPPFIF